MDWLVLGVLGLALARGLLRGLLREAFSIASLGAACVAVKLFYGDVAEWIIQISNGGVGEMAAPWAAGVLLAVSAIGAVTILGRLVRRGARAAGLGWADRAGGAVLGTAEGVLVAGIVIAVAGALVGREHPLLADSRSLEALEELEAIAAQAREPQDTPNVAAGPQP